MAEKLTPEEINNRLDMLDAWTLVNGRGAIHKTFKFENFKQAFAFMTRAAEKAEQMNHHPEWCNVYSTVEVTLTTHDSNGVTVMDLELAGFMDEAAAG